MLLATTLLYLALCTPDPTKSPTPVLRFDRVTAPDLAGYAFYVYQNGAYTKLVEWRCDPYDTDADNIPDACSWRGVDTGIAIQRYCPTCQPFNSYTFAVTAFDYSGNYSAPSNPVTVCMPPICTSPGPCN